jgi:hypothetical protein
MATNDGLPVEVKVRALKPKLVAPSSTASATTCLQRA